MNSRKVLIIGGTGHIGAYLVPRLVQSGFEVHVVARNAAPRYADPEIGWPSVHWIVADREAEEKTGAWAARMRSIEVNIVIDLMCFTIEQQRTMFEAFRGRIDHFLHCGSIWAYGSPERLPYEEYHQRRPIGDYGKRKAEIEDFLFELCLSEKFPATVIHPGHISGRGWMPVDPQGSRDNVDVYQRLATGGEVILPEGKETVHHVHADDVAQQFELAIFRREHVLGESFSAVAPYAMTLTGCCRAVAGMFGHQPNLRYVPLAELEHYFSAEAAGCIRDHVVHSPCCSIDKARRLLGYQPRYTTEQIFAECIESLIESGQLKTGSS